MKRRALFLYNTESLQKEEVVPLDGKTIRMYTCGPTVYNFAHIGNFRTYVFEDLLRRTIKFFGFPIQQAMNLTDIDDKTIKGAVQNKISLDEFTKPFKEAFFADLATLGIEKVEFYPQATDYIPEMIAMIETLKEKGIAYLGQDGSTYFAINQFPSYGRLAHLNLESLKAGASNRVQLDEYEKENVCDFVLWKAYDPERDGGIYWESPFGKGRPGWHIECSAMASKLLGKTIDLHVGGVDNLFPHHENEIAQSEGCFCCRFVKHWLHAEHLLVDHKKMSKSLGNFYTLRDLLQKGYSGKVVRYALLQAHYRTQLNFTFESLEASASTLRRLEDFILRMKEICDEKIQVALDKILEKALPANLSKKQISERILFEFKKGERRDIFDAADMKPLVEKGLPSFAQKTEVAHLIAQEMSGEGKKAMIEPILERALKTAGSSPDLVSKILVQVREEKGSDLLNPEVLQPILARALPKAAEREQVLSYVFKDLNDKKTQGFVFPLLQKAMQEFEMALADDLNISLALSAVFELVREVNILCDRKAIGFAIAEDVLDFFRKIDEVLNIIPLTKEEEEIPEHLKQALQMREEARLAKDWKTADRCRDQILSSGYLVEDTPLGARLKKIGIL